MEKTLQGNLTLEDLGIIVNAVKDILINGASIIDKNGNAVIPVLGDGEHNVGLVRLYAEDVKSNGGLLHWATSGPRKGCPRL